MSDAMSRRLYTLDDEDNPKTSKANLVWPATILDQVYDNLSPDNKTLRQIIEDLHQEILTGGKGNIVFPVTSVNGKEGDVTIDKLSVGLGRVDNTRDVDKPLSVPQRSAVMDILKGYDFKVNLDDLYNHINDTSNPHRISIDQLNVNNELSMFAQREIAKHNTSLLTSVHPDIRSSISRLWRLTESIDARVDSSIAKANDNLVAHIEDKAAHVDIFNTKENISNKARVISDETTNHNAYPTTRAVLDAIISKISEFNETLPDVRNWIDSILVVDTIDQLPEACATTFRQAYFIKYGETAQGELAICKVNEDQRTYFWDRAGLGWYSKFNVSQFKNDNVDGISLNMENLVQRILGEHGLLDDAVNTILSDYYSKKQMDEIGYIHKISFKPGTMNGTIRFYINDDLDTMSDDIHVAGLQRLAYLEWVTEDELHDNAVRSNHILSNSLMTRHYQTSSIEAEHIRCGFGYVIGNLENHGEKKGNEIHMLDLADQLRPILGGYPDPNSPENPWNAALDRSVIKPHHLDPGSPKAMDDGSIVERFTDLISVLPNMNLSRMLTDKITCKTHRLIGAGGSWTIQSYPEEWAILGGSNLTGHTFGTIRLTEKGLFFDSISTGDRRKAPIDIWVQYYPI